MAVRMGFEPYIDYDALTFEQAETVQECLREYRDATEHLIAATSREQTVHHAVRVLRASQLLGEKVHETMRVLHVVPVMVHLAGTPGEETNPADSEQDGIVQRCVRCGSILHLWQEGMCFFDPENGPRAVELEDIPWWGMGEVVAKAHGGGMYRIDNGRPLMEHEHECADLSELTEPK